MTGIAAFERFKDFEKIRGQSRLHIVNQWLREIVKVRLTHRSRNASLGVGVAAERDSEPDRVLGGIRVEAGNQRLRHGTLAAYVERIVGTNALNGTVRS
jgi:hypothetical protein